MSVNIWSINIITELAWSWAHIRITQGDFDFLSLLPFFKLIALAPPQSLIQLFWSLTQTIVCFSCPVHSNVHPN
jgi:hypothetical protein